MSSSATYQEAVISDLSTRVIEICLPRVTTILVFRGFGGFQLCFVISNKLASVQQSRSTDIPLCNPLQRPSRFVVDF